MAAIIGMWLFAGLLKIENDNDNVVLKNHRSNFDTISQAFVTVFHVIQGDDWNLVWYNCVNGAGVGYAHPYFVVV